MPSIAFESQPLKAPLNDGALRSLGEVTNDKTRTTKLAKLLKDAAQHLTETVGDVRETAHDRTERYERERRRRKDNDDGNDVAEQAHEEFQKEVETLTNKMDMSIRAIVDDQIWLEDLPNVLKTAFDKAARASKRAEQSGGTQESHPTRHTDSDDNEDQDEEDEEPTNGRTRSTQTAPTSSNTPYALLSSALQKQQKTWSTKTPTERYAHNNTYTGFKRNWFEGDHPGDEKPPMPAPGLWFAAEEGREVISSSQRHRHGASAEDDNDDSSESEVEIAKEKTRLKCPITFLPFQDPVTSDKCGHSYERFAILEMLNASRDRPKQVHCPECNVALTEDDLQPNPSLKRRVQRLLAQAAKKKARGGVVATSEVDGDEDDDVRGAGTDRRPVGLGSSPVPPSTGKSRRNIKAERAPGSRPGTAQTGTSRSGILDVEHDDLA
ncbi:hypothetical protein LTR10_015121 [Elasticomyces elasticus]|uniref:peptidylprolyl isomerase n=1 Tax=Exophiala sideris TaxID=1016849 RepID=A0ABR0JQX7_9EURO|nr:hypothetical protein LTR10_015121 [Elasticomyces elasticus]KAK5034681.1 hypothetical protein LTR13_006337 [Exophiala sideris]KAK5039997.1 hypothetical protein LTS07_000492 [Exophiala sideris]KAK5068375.1 hypothetical protein LTR69_000493 [Exophiala sideris]KAK5187677.1 hypothetical protein LTR44_000493 [Eurotiomycetes sp. CCFEE 6388]